MICIKKPHFSLFHTWWSCTILIYNSDGRLHDDHLLGNFTASNSGPVRWQIPFQPANQFWISNTRNKHPDKTCRGQICCVSYHQEIAIIYKRTDIFKDIISSVRRSSVYPYLLHTYIPAAPTFSFSDSSDSKVLNVLCTYFLKARDSRISNMTFPCIKCKIH